MTNLTLPFFVESDGVGGGGEQFFAFGGEFTLRERQSGSELREM